MVKQRSITLFDQAIKSEATNRVYHFYLQKFLDFYHIKNFDSLIKIEPPKLQVMLEDYLFDLKKRVSPRTVRTMFFALELFFSMNDIVLNFKKIKRMFPQVEKPTGIHAYTTKDVQKILDICKSRKKKALVLLLASSGIRIGAVSELKLEHLRDMPHGCQALMVYPDSKDEYVTFLTPEAVEALSDYLEERRKIGEELSQDSPLFRTDYNKLGLGRIKPMTSEALTAMMYRLASFAHTNRHRQTSNRYTIQGAHGLRKRFNTILKSNKDVNLNLAERLMGHSQTIRLDNSYFDPTVESLFEEYKKIIVKLSVSEEIRLKLENELKDKKIEQLESDKDRRISELESGMENINELLKRIPQS